MDHEGRRQMGEQTIHKKMEELRMVCEREIPIQQHRAENATLAFGNSLQSIKLNAQQTAQHQVKLGQLRGHLRELEDDLVKALAVKNSKEAKHITIIDSISAAKARTEELKRSLHDQKAKKDEYAAIMSQQLIALAQLEEKANQEIKDKEEIQEIISWYNQVLGLRIEGGRGIKVIFNNLNMKDPNEEYSFTIRLAHEKYILLNCDPHLDGTEELTRELNQTNGFFKFVRTMRERFQAAASIGLFPQPTSTQPHSCVASVSAPASPVSHDGTEYQGNGESLLVQSKEISRSPKNGKHGRRGRPRKSAGRAPRSISPLHHSSRLNTPQQEVSSASAASPVSHDGAESQGNEKFLQLQSKEISRSPKNGKHGRRGQSPGSGGRAPRSISPLRHSSRLNKPQQEFSSGSAASPVSHDGTESQGNEKFLQLQSEEISRSPKKTKHGRKGQSPGSGGRASRSTSPLRRSARLNTPQQEVSSGSADRSL